MCSYQLVEVLLPHPLAHRLVELGEEPLHPSLLIKLLEHLSATRHTHNFQGFSGKISILKGNDDDIVKEVSRQYYLNLIWAFLKSF